MNDALLAARGRFSHGRDTAGFIFVRFLQILNLQFLWHGVLAPAAFRLQVPKRPRHLGQALGAGNPQPSIASQRHGCKSSEAGLAGRSQPFGPLRFLAFLVEFQQPVRKQAQHQPLPDRTQRNPVDQAHQAGAEFCSNFRHRMKHPGALPELLQTFRHHRP